LPWPPGAASCARRVVVSAAAASAVPQNPATKSPLRARACIVAVSASVKNGPNLTLLAPPNATQSPPAMIALIQRVSRAEVRVADQLAGQIGRGILSLIGVSRDDAEADAERLLERVLAYRIFPDATGRMNLSLRDIGGGLLLVPQFTLAADTQKGTRAG